MRDLVAKGAARCRSERGAMAVVVAVCMVALLGVAAIAVDSGNNWQQQRQLRTALEASALATAAAHAWGDDGCFQTAADYLSRNHPSATLTSCTANGDLVNGTFGWVSVEAEVTVDQLFGGVLGQPSVPIHSTSHAMFGVPWVAGEGPRPMGLCLEAIETDPDFIAWQNSGTDSPVFSIPVVSAAASACGYTAEAPEPECSAEDVGELVLPSGDASYDADAAIFDITPDEFGQRGAVMSTDRVDLRDDFAMTFDVYTGNNDGGADGIGFVFHNDPNGVYTLGGFGGGVGMSGIRNSIGIEFDTWHNGEQRPAGPGTESVPALRSYTRYSNNSGSTSRVYGYRFRADINNTITHLGAFDANGNGKLDNGPQTTVTLWNDYGLNLATAQIPESTPVEADGFAYVELPTPISISGGQTYRVAAKNDGEGIINRGSATMAPGFTFRSLVYGNVGYVLPSLVNPVGASNYSGGLGASFKALEYLPPRQAGDDPPGYEDHTAIYDVEHYTDPEYLKFYGPESRLSPLVTLPNIENDTWHTAIVEWDASEQELFYSFDGFTIARLNIDLVNDHILGNYAHFGFAGSTGGAKNRHRLRFTNFDVTLENPHPECTGDDDTTTVGGGNWSLIDFDGNTTDDAIFNDWILNGYGSDTAPGDYEGVPGGLDAVHQASLQTLVDSGEIVTIPLYRNINDTGTKTIFEVTAFGEVRVTDFNITGPIGTRYINVIFTSGLKDRACCIDIPTDGTYVETNQRATRIVALNSDGTPKRR